jgi:NitT/TauT family transport system ATP-binding protein
MAKKVKLEVEITKRFSQLLVLDRVKFSVYENEFLVLVGPTGCGKTTLANIIGCLIPPTEGRVLIDGQPVNPKKHNLSFVFQEPSCLPWRTLWNDVKVGLEIKKFSRGSLEERIRRVIHVVGLDGFEKYYPHQISGGMKQRVAIARAYATEPDLLLMDEPFGHLDAQTRYLMQLEITRIWQEMKRTVVFVTNNIEEAVSVAERIIVFSKLPAQICGEIKVDLPHPRDNISPEFLALRTRVSELCGISE